MDHERPAHAPKASQQQEEAMKSLAGKFCRRCYSQHIALAAEGEVTVIRCLECSMHSTFCPNPGCGGDMRNVPHTKEQKCHACGYETHYHEKSSGVQLQLALDCA